MNSEFDEIDHDHRQRELKEGEYWIASCGSGRIACYAPGITLVDFYRSAGVLAPVKPKLCPKESSISTPTGKT